MEAITLGFKVDFILIPKEDGSPFLKVADKLMEDASLFRMRINSMRSPRRHLQEVPRLEPFLSIGRFTRPRCKGIPFEAFDLSCLNNEQLIGIMHMRLKTLPWLVY